MWVREEVRGWDDGFWIGLNCQFRDLTGSLSVFLLGVPEEAFSSVFASTSLTLPLRLSIFFLCLDGWSLSTVGFCYSTGD